MEEKKGKEISKRAGIFAKFANFSHPTLRTKNEASLNLTNNVMLPGKFWKLLESRMTRTSSPYTLKIPHRWQEVVSYNAKLCTNAKFENNAQIET